jgi:pimeloyl-ACP methyl ester carboxylesterase
MRPALARSPRAAALVVVAALLVLAPAAHADLRFEGSCGGNFECAQLKVPLDHTGVIPGKLTLSIERARAQGRRHEGAVFALAGGPGQAGSSVAEGFNLDTFGAIGTRDLIIVDQRGTGRSGALECRALEVPDDRPIDVRTRVCADRLGARRSLYTTRDTVEDLEAVRAALGIDQITLLGVSYGTKVALNYAQAYPEHVERLVLDSVVEPGGQSPFELDSFAALPRILTEVCRGECDYDLAADVAALAQRLPLRGPLVDPRGRRLRRTVTARDLYQQIRAGDLIAELRVAYPGAVHAALSGDLAPLVRLIHGGELAAPAPGPSQAETLSFTLQAATLCEEAPLPEDPRAAAEEIPDSAFAPFDREVALARDSNSLIFQCSRWPDSEPRYPPLPDALPDVPVLVYEGLEDTRTPLEVGERVAARFPRAAVVAAPKTGHSVLGGARCARVALKRFFADREPGTPCAEVARAKKVTPVPPRTLADVPGGTLGAVRLTLADLRATTRFGTSRGGGLRGGTFRERGRGYRLRRFSYVPGVALTGNTGGVLRVTGRAAEPMKVRLRRGKPTPA